MDDKSTIVESKLMSNHLSAPTPSQTSVLVTSTSTIASSSSRTSAIPSPTNLNNGNSISHKIESLVQTSSQPSSSSYFPTQTQAPMPNFNYNTNSNHFYPPNIMNYPQGQLQQQHQQQPHPPHGLIMSQPSATSNNYLFNNNSAMMYPQPQVPSMFNPMTNGMNPSGMTYPPQMLGTPGMPPQSTTSNSSLAQALATPPALMMPQHQQIMQASSSHLAPSHSPVRHLSTSSTSSSISSPSHSSSSTKSTKMVNGNEETKKVIFKIIIKNFNLIQVK